MAGETERETFRTVLGMDQFRIQQLGQFRGVTRPSVVLPIPVPNTSGLFPKVSPECGVDVKRRIYIHCLCNKKAGQGILM